MSLQACLQVNAITIWMIRDIDKELLVAMLTIKTVEIKIAMDMLGEICHTKSSDSHLFRSTDSLFIDNKIMRTFYSNKSLSINPLRQRILSMQASVQASLYSRKIINQFLLLKISSNSEWRNCLIRSWSKYNFLDLIYNKVCLKLNPSKKYRTDFGNILSIELVWCKTRYKNRG